MEYFDFYLLHNVYEKNIDAYLNPEYGILEYLLQQKKAGRIRHLGFSAHARYETLEHFLKACGEHMEFCQIQLNYLDWKLQDAKAKVELLNAYHMPVWVMEPLRGGRLAQLSEENTEKLKTLRPEEEIPAWAFRFLQSVPGVTVVLSGMSNMEQMEKNIYTYEEDKPLSEGEQKVLAEVTDSMLDTLPCTACRYCVTHCPKDWTFLPCFPCIMKCVLPITSLSRWRRMPWKKRSVRRPVSAVKAVRQFVLRCCRFLMP